MHAPDVEDSSPICILLQAVWEPEKRAEGHRIATFAGGCFWSVQLVFDRLDGVIASSVGYAQGHKSQPTYKEVREFWFESSCCNSGAWLGPARAQA